MEKPANNKKPKDTNKKYDPNYIGPVDSRESFNQDMRAIYIEDIKREIDTGFDLESLN